MQNCKEYFEKTQENDTKKILSEGFNKIINNKEVKAGSSTNFYKIGTALIVNLFLKDNKILLKSSNLGDSGNLNK
jgi:hypothetical protein